MNTQSTQYHQYERAMSREEYRELMRRSCIPAQRRLGRSERTHETIEMAKLAIFAAGMLLLTGYGLMWSLG